MYVPLRLGFFIIARHCASLFFSIAFFLEISLLRSGVRWGSVHRDPAWVV